MKILSIRPTLAILSVSTLLASSLLVGCASKGPKGTGDLTSGQYAQDQSGQNGSDGGAETAGVNGDMTFSDGSSMASLPSICRAAAPTPGKSQRYFFAFNQDTPNTTIAPSLQAQSHYVATHSTTRITITGNTDDRGSREYNIALGWRRAHAIANQLEQYGVNKKQIVLLSYGPEKPAAMGQTEAAYQCNRRVDLTYKG